MNMKRIKNYEVMMVDYGSSDKTFEFVKLLHKKTKNIYIGK